MTNLRRARGEDGATLIIVLVLVTFISVVLGVVLDQADTAARSTVALGDQAASQYAADGAGQAVVSQLSQGTFPSNCVTPAATAENLGSSGSPFYVVPGTGVTSYNAAVNCAPDTVDGVTTTQVGTGEVTIDDNNTLGYSVLTVGSNTGQSYGTVCVAGGSVVSNSTINVGKLRAGLTDPASCTVTANPAIKVTAASATGCNGFLNDSNANDFTPTPCTHGAAIPQTGATGWATAVAQPLSGYNTTVCVSGLPANCGVDPAPLCSTSNAYAAFRPGKYTKIPGTGSACSGANTFWFTPGVYYFDFAVANTTWNWPSTLIGGTPQDASGNVVGSLVGFNVQDSTTANKQKLATGLAAVTNFPGACADPALTADLGVEFVFGGSSVFSPNTSDKNEICATYDANTRPVAIYGVSTDVVGGTTMSLTGGGTIRSQTLCAVPPCGFASTNASIQQTMISFGANGHESVFVHGYLYAPSAPLYFRIKNSQGVLLGWGVIFRSLDIDTNGASPEAPYIVYRPAFQQKFTTVTTYSIRYLNVWTCPASASACPQTGPPNVRVKVQTVGGTTKVLSWSQQR